MAEPGLGPRKVSLNRVWTVIMAKREATAYGIMVTDIDNREGPRYLMGGNVLEKRKGDI